MKKVVTLIALLLVGSGAFAQLSTVRGVAKNVENKEICLLLVEDGKGKVLATTPISEDGSFGFLFTPPSEGFYAVGYPNFMKGQFPFYLKKGDNVDLSIDKHHVEYPGQQTPENQVLARWMAMSGSLREKSLYFMGANSTFRDFFPELEALAKQTGDFRKTIRTKNPRFNDLMTKLTGYDMDLFALSILFTPRSEQPQESDFPPYYNSIVVENKYPNNDILSTLNGDRTLGLYVSYASLKNKVETPEGRLALLSTDEQKAVYLMSALPRIKSYNEYLDFVTLYGKYFTTPAHKALLDAVGTATYNEKQTNVAADFTYPDQGGKMVSLSDFKGKVVVVDVWATWCSPCKKELPFLGKLEEEFHGKDVVFVSVSVDEEKDKDKWIAMIAEQKLGGVQLFASGWSKITKDYKIDGIPRFMVFDKKGDLVDMYAPRPSDPKLKELLEAELKK